VIARLSLHLPTNFLLRKGSPLKPWRGAAQHKAVAHACVVFQNHSFQNMSEYL
jgi:hypothetical protein